MTLLMTILAEATRASTPAASQTPGVLITARGAIVVAIFGYLGTGSGAAGTIKQRRATPDRPEVDGFAIARLTADPEPEIAEVAASQWSRRKWAWFDLAAALGAVTTLASRVVLIPLRLRTGTLAAPILLLRSKSAGNRAGVVGSVFVGVLQGYLSWPLLGGESRSRDAID
jgi:hypothetical protein